MPPCPSPAGLVNKLLELLGIFLEHSFSHPKINNINIKCLKSNKMLPQFLIVQILDLHEQQCFNIRVTYTIDIYMHEVHKDVKF